MATERIHTFSTPSLAWHTLSTSAGSVGRLSPNLQAPASVTQHKRKTMSGAVMLRVLCPVQDIPGGISSEKTFRWWASNRPQHRWQGSGVT